MTHSFCTAKPCLRIQRKCLKCNSCDYFTNKTQCEHVPSTGGRWWEADWRSSFFTQASAGQSAARGQWGASEGRPSDLQQSAVSSRRAVPGDAGNELEGIFSDQDTQDNGCCHSGGIMRSCKISKWMVVCGQNDKPLIIAPGNYANHSRLEASMGVT